MLSYGIISTPDNPTLRVAIRIQDKIVDLARLIDTGLLDKNLRDVINSTTLNALICKGKPLRQELKEKITSLLATDPHCTAIKKLGEVTLHHPLAICGYTDFYASKQHATNIGKIFRPDNPLMPNWQHLPIAYNGRASSVVISNYPVKRPHGQIANGEQPQFTACKKLDFEVELGVVIGKDSILGQPIDVNHADEYIFGICIVNDWSARDIQAWEYQPLGPFTSKSFLTSISSFIIPIEELEEAKTSAVVQDPKPLPYLNDANPHSYDIEFKVILKTANSPEEMVIAITNFKYIYWTMRQWIAHHTVTGCNLKVGDLLASGTISGNDSKSLGSLMELTVNGRNPLKLPNGEERSFLENGDELIIKGFAGAKRAFIGEVSGKIIG